MESIFDKTRGEFSGINVPERKNGFCADLRQVFLAISSQVAQKDIAEAKMLNAALSQSNKRFRHVRFVDGIGALRWDGDFLHRQADGFGLLVKEFAANAMHADAIGALVTVVRRATTSKSGL